MTNVKDLRKSITTTTPVLALVGATELVVETVRSARDHHVVQGAVQQVPAVAVAKTAELVARAESTYGDLAARGDRLMRRVAAQKATQDLLAQGKVTLSKGKAAVTTARRVATGTPPSSSAPSTSAPGQPVVGLAGTSASRPGRTGSATPPATAPTTPPATPPATKPSAKAPGRAAAKPADKPASTSTRKPASKRATKPAAKDMAKDRAPAVVPAERVPEVTRAIHEAAEKADS